ncbi:FG-GAP repeat domain-containing protein [Verticillium dahliae VdLs.17]|uniref:FG-GAP repeat domain-containing protein n=1 Tax=Verticillium dahliae (strain VdLs.17 / ATCC MYA-4575 / FGSC 10137) TaxID=498257 RepID=G2XG79_VERDV|nr:FG-GAP repeat domain-containing protein [Verticillium dahliae VdLs.17]EGY18706.1 FG-GAP repeat domain-containing protein [Verticillium dahliae VdLs.17]KAH6702398.1 FG-GAP repeat domain-containing protein [Verticillium dahliae]
MPSPRLRHGLVWATALAAGMASLVAGQSLPDLRIMPLGDSITKGSGSSDNNGYRNRLRQKLTTQGTDTEISVDMIGSMWHGTMADNDHEGHSGEYLRQIRTYLQRSIQARPNVVLVHAGTNNMDKEVDLGEAPALIEGIIDDLLQGSPNTVVLVAPVIWANDARMNANTDRFNKQLTTLIASKQKAGEHVLAVPIAIGAGDLSDRKHPNNAGYGKMADAWFNAILEAHERGWIKAPAKVNADELSGMGLGWEDAPAGAGSAGCGGRNFESKGQVFDGFRVWEEVGTIRGPVENGRRNKVILADLNGDGISDYVVADDDGTVRAWINGGKPNQWTSIGKINPDWSTITGDMVRMADVDNDGRADLIVLYSDGAAKVWKNTDKYVFKALDSQWATGLAPRENVNFKDMDGDGFADYVVVYSGGAVKWARNTQNNGKDQNKRNWEAAVTVAPGPQGVPENRVRVQDLDGDGKADYLIVYDGGAVKSFLNTGNLNSNGEQRNWLDLGTIVPGVSGVTGSMIRFADMDGDGQSDFLAVADDGSIRMWKNLGIVGTKGASLRFADLTGDGKADIVSVNHKGRARAWLNKGLGVWDDIGEIAPGLDEDLSSATIHFADVNGDKRADFLVVYGEGGVKAYLNNGNLPDKGKDRIWQTGQTISEGVGEPGRKVRFADLNGDGYADYLVVFDGGAVDAWLNQKNIPATNGGRIWGYRSTVATGVGEPGSKVRFADITGDGKADYLIQYVGGAVKGYNNTGNIPDIGRARNWANMGTISTGTSPQGPVRYADLNGDGKDDYLVVFGSGIVHAYINSCDWRAPEPVGSGEGDEIDGDSTCEDIKRWLSFDSNANDGVPRAFASEWGFDSVSCPILGDCGFPNDCSGYSKSKGSGRAHLIMKSLDNLHSYYKAMYQAVSSTLGYFNAMQRVFEQYYPEPSLEDVGIKALLQMTEHILGVGTAMAGSDTGELIVNGLFSTVSGVAENALENKDEPLRYAADLAKVGFRYFNNSAAAIETMHNTLLKQGHYEGPDGAKIILDDVFKNGAWLNSDKIPILSQSEKDGVPRIGTSELASWFFAFLHASILNYSWRNSLVFIVGHKMTRKEFDDGAADIDDNLKAYHDGRGYFLQSFCECKNNEDKNGKRFIDQLRYADDLKRACSTSWDPTEGTD